MDLEEKMAAFYAIQFNENRLVLLDQRKLPVTTAYFECKTLAEVIFAIKDMVVRGAPAIGATAAYGMYIGALELGDALELQKLYDVKAILDASRPTAVNLMWATSRIMEKLVSVHPSTTEEILKVIKSEADAIFNEDAASCKAMAVFGNTLVAKNDQILTHCNTGALATVAYGTALGVIREAHETGKNIHVFADETRPRLQGARLTAWELVTEEIPATLIPDNAAASLIRDGKINKIFVGADRIARNGDTANKIGTFMLSVIAKRYNVPFYIVAPSTTFDFDIQSGEAIEIELRDAREVTHVGEEQVAPNGIHVYNPAFDVTPNEFITAIVTEKGILYPPFTQSISDKLIEE